MATETVDRRSSHIRSVTVTTLASVLGIFAGVASDLVATSASDPTGVLVAAAAIGIQFPILKAVGIDVEDFSKKDYAFVAFMTFSLWFLSWSILLSSGAV